MAISGVKANKKTGAAHAKHAMTVATLIFERILWQSYCFPYTNWFFFFWMNEWMMHLYSALLCIVVHPKRFIIICGGGSLLNHHQCAASTWMMRRLPQDNGRQCAHHTPATGGEERVIETIKWMGIIRRPWLTRTSGGNLARTPGLHPYSLREVPWDF